MTSRLVVVALATLLSTVSLAGCAGAPSHSASAPSAAAPSPADRGGSTEASCAIVDSKVEAIIGPVAHPTDRTAADLEICTWVGRSDGRGVATFIATVAPSSRYHQLAQAVGARGYGAGTPLDGFDNASVWTDESLGTFVLLASAGSRVVQLEGSAAKIPDAAGLAAIAHALIG
jgi:hypothetical protein